LFDQETLIVRVYFYSYIIIINNKRLRVYIDHTHTLLPACDIKSHAIIIYDVYTPPEHMY